MRGGSSTNPTAADEDVSWCFICGSKFHLVRSCPDSYENNENKKDDVVALATDETEESAHLSLFIGYKSEQRSCGTVVERRTTLVKYPRFESHSETLDLVI